MSRRLVVYGREPAPGGVKRRLESTVGREAAVAVYRALLEHTLAVARASGEDWVLSLADPPSRAWRRALGDTVWELQCGGDLGERLAASFARHFAGGAREVVIIGSDCPGLRSRHLHEAYRRLAENDVVLGPAVDGGYWLVGQRSPGRDLFSEIPWSSPVTLAATRRRLEELAVAASEVAVLADVDTEADLAAAIADTTLPEALRQRLREASRAR